ncbi:hypothetical protein CHS0354_038637 [Potamilus streckersoni]|uniref:Uncharacterized protein n=1 Tax=Potamilus streckersoni TaxID=2493646 RepID=A0AAE0T7J3_9BIVA|nr:hypothetical protein CHS0354_038637 [Potamilus streckersoni]
MLCGECSEAYFRSRRVMIFLLMITVLAAKVSEQEMTSKLVCSGESILLFEKEKITASGHLTSLYIFKEVWKLIANWESGGTIINTGHYDWKVFFDGYGNLMIGNIDETGEGKYRIQQRQGKTIGPSYNQKLTVMAAPTTKCKPKINTDGNDLVVSVEYTECGKPEPSLNFVDQSHFAHVSKTAENKTLAKFKPGKEAGTYIACIDTPAFRCATNFKTFDLCSHITLPERPIGTMSSDQVKILVLAYLSNILLIIGLPGLICYMHCYMIPSLRGNITRN